MPREDPPLRSLHELTPSDEIVDCFALLAEKKRLLTRNGNPYYQCRFRDNRRTVAAMIWTGGELFEECESKWEAGHFYRIRGAYGERLGPQFELMQIRLVNEDDAEDGFDRARLVEASRFDPEAMLAELIEITKRHIVDEPLRRLVLTLLERHGESLMRLPARQNRFFTFAGGLIEHLLSVTKSCLFLVERYAAYYTELNPPLNKDLVVAGAILHDIGRVHEYGDDPLGCTVTVDGQFFGHLFLGRDIVRDAALDQGDVHPDLLRMLEHVIITHLTLPAWGSPRLPLIPEVLILHHADDLDAKMEMYVRCLTRDTAPGAFTDQDPILRRQLYKGREL